MCDFTLAAIIQALSEEQQIIILNLLTEKRITEKKKTQSLIKAVYAGDSDIWLQDNKDGLTLKNGSSQCVFLLLARCGNAPRMLCAIRSCLVKIPTIGDI